MLETSMGSPPPMRGKVVFHMEFVQHHRITPAYAGKSTCGKVHGKSIRDHPRLCGEKDIVYMHTPQQLGSPPPMRGKG